MARTGEPEIDRRLRNLHLVKSLQSYGFLMHLRVGRCTGPDFKEILKLTEALMVRRHTCRERSNENDTLFAHFAEQSRITPFQQSSRNSGGILLLMNGSVRHS